MEKISFFVVIMIAAFLGTMRLMFIVCDGENMKLKHFIICFTGMLLLNLIFYFIFKAMDI